MERMIGQGLLQKLLWVYWCRGGCEMQGAGGEAEGGQL